MPVNVVAGALLVIAPVDAVQRRPVRASRCCSRRTTARRCSARTATPRTTATSAGGTSAASVTCRRSARWTPRCRRWTAGINAVDYVTDHLRRLPVVVAARVGRLLDVYGLESLVALDVGEEKAEWAVWAGIVCWWLLAAAAVVGWRALGRSGDGAAERSRARWWLAVPVLTVLITTILFYGAHRIRAPAEPAIVVLAAAGVVAVAERRSIAPPDARPRFRRSLDERGVAHSRCARRRARPRLDAKVAALEAELRQLGRVVVAFSGGADSAFLAAVAHRTLGPNDVARRHRGVAVAGRRRARRLPRAGREWGLRWTPVDTDEMARAAYRVNDTDRCYHCKAELMDVVAPIADAEAATDRARRQRRRPRRPPAGPASRHRGRGRVPARGRRVHEGRRPRRVPPARAADVGQAGGRLPGQPRALRHRGHRAAAVAGSSGPRPRCARSASPRSASATTATRRGSRSSSAELPRVVAASDAVVAAVRAAGYRYVTLDLEGFRSGNLNRLDGSLRSPGRARPA